MTNGLIKHITVEESTSIHVQCIWVPSNSFVTQLALLEILPAIFVDIVNS